MTIVEFLREINSNNENADLLTFISAESVTLFLRELILGLLGVDLLCDDDDFRSQLRILSSKVERDEDRRDIVMSLIGLRRYFSCEVARISVDDARILARFIKNLG